MRKAKEAKVEALANSRNNASHADGNRLYRCSPCVLAL
jgi:hypothetical protein